jgi:hypothetical protein
MFEEQRNCNILKGYETMNSSVLIKSGGFVAQSLSKLRGNRPGVVAALFTMLLFLAGCGGSTKTATPAPTFTPAAGSYSVTQNVTVSDTNQNAVLYCTNDGSAPTASSVQCANPIKVSQSQTLRAVAIAPGMDPSTVASAAYTIGASTSTSVVTAVTPASGPAAGGTTVTIAGTNLSGVTAVNFGTIPATGVTVNSANSITAISPAGTGSVHVTVVSSSGTSTTSTADLFTYISAPAITSLSPTSGIVGSSVTITGTNFGASQGTSTVTFAGAAASITSWSNTLIVAVVPAGATTGNVVVTVNGATSAVVPFTVVVPVPAISLLTPSSGVVGTSVAIIGSNFGSTQGTSTVTFNGTPATSITSWTPTSIVTVVPVGATTGNVVVTVGGIASAGGPFTVTVPIPTITSLSPTSATAGGVGFTLTVNGTNFDSSAKVNWNASALATTYVSATQVTAAVPTNLIASAGTASITVSTTAGTSGASTFTIQSGAPTITGINPTSATAGGAAFTLTVNGSSFDSSAKVNWNGSALTTSYINGTQVTAAVPASLIASAGTANITVSTTAGTSSTSSFTVQAASPTISGTSPTSATVGGAAFTLTVNGTNFDSSTKVNWNGAALTTTYVNGTKVTANVPASLIASVGTANISVTTNAGTSAVSTFTIQLGAPTIATISPTSVSAGGAAFTLTVNGANFDSSAVVKWNGTALATTPLSSTQLTATVPVNLIASTGSASITVATSAGTSSASNLAIQQAGVPTISTLDPASVTAGGSAFLLTVNGTGFDSSSVVKWNGTSLTTIYVSSTELQVAISANLIAAGGTVSVTVSGTVGTSTASSFAIKLGTPTISGFNPTSADSNDPTFTTLTVNGTNFDSSAVANWNSIALTTTFVNATQITASVPASLIASPVTASITVKTTAGTSAASSFTVNLGKPTIVSTDPTSVTAGGASFPLKVTGTNFDSSAKINWNGTAQTTQLKSATEVDATIDSTLIVAAGSATITVTTTAGTSATSYTLTINAAAPTVTGISPTSGTSAGGTSVSITGTNFTGATAVYFGTAAATGLTINSPTSINVVSPAGSVGTVDVTVVTPAGTSVTSTADQFTYTAPLPTISGKVLSGPASSGTAISASVQLYAAGTTGYGKGPQPIGSPVQSNSTTGAFSITYDCSALSLPGGDQLYLEAVEDSKVVLMTALGSCSSISASFPSGVTVNEATTIASAFALSAFASIDSSSNGGIDIGAPADTTTGSKCDPTDQWKSTGPSTCNYIGLKNAFATVQNLVDIPSGTALSITPYYKNNPGAGVGYNISQVPQARINSLANVLASCANPTGTSTNCDSLSSYTTGATGADTLQAALNIALHPGNNASQIAGLATAMPSFQTSLTSTQLSALTDWALAVVYQGAGQTSLNATGLAIDAQGNIWIPDDSYAEAPSGQNGTVGGTAGLVAVFSNLGIPISPSATSSSAGGYTGVVSGNKSIINPQSIAIDQNGYAWIGNYPSTAGSTAGSVTVLDVNGNVKFESPYTNSLLFLPHQGGMAVDANNNVWVSSNVGYDDCQYSINGGSILALSAAGGSVSPTGIVADHFSSDNSSCPTFLTIDQNGNMWTYDNGNYYGADAPLSTSLDLLSTTDGSLQGGPYWNDSPVFTPNVAMDSSKNAWFSAYFYNGVQQSGSGTNTTTRGLAKMANLAGTIGDNSSSVGADPTVFLPPGYSSNSYPFISTVAIDGNSNAWIIGWTSVRGLYEMSNGDTTLLSPADGFSGYDSNGLNPIGGASYANPFSTAVDNSGNVWVVSPSGALSDGTQTGGTLAEYVGIGVPTPAPLVSGLVGNNLGQKP